MIAKSYGTKYHIDQKLSNKWDLIKDGKLTKLDEDRVYVVDGRERTGKSLWTLQQAAYIDPTLIGNSLKTKKLSRITFSGEETLQAIKKTRSTKDKTKVIIFDEAFRGLSSRSVLSKTNKLIVQALMEMGQKNLVLFIVLPSIFFIDKYPAMLRSNALFHIKKEKNSRKRVFEIYNYSKKASLYLLGTQKGWKYPIHTRLKGRFFNKWPGGAEFEKLYRKKKHDSLTEIEKEINAKKVYQVPGIYRDFLLYYLISNHKESKAHLSRLCNKYGLPLDEQSIRRAANNVKEQIEKHEKGELDTEKPFNVSVRPTPLTPLVS